ncbi:WbqC family protein [bacterium]|nr:WbqC family protein [bacterium]
MTGVILQPTYIPWLGYFEMIDRADIFVIYDHVQFVKKTWHHRNRIKNKNGELLLSIPTKNTHLKTPIYDICLSSEYEKVLVNHWLSIFYSYKNSKFFYKYSDSLHALYTNKYSTLMELTVEFIKYFCKQLGISIDIEYSSNLTLDGKLTNSTEKVADICDQVNISTLYDANGAKSIIDKTVLNKCGINVVFQKYKHPVYTQMFGDFIPYMSIIDLIMNEGDRSLDIVKSGSLFNI